MALDNAQFIAELSITDPPGTDPLSQGDDQIRTIKRATQQSFPNIDAAVTLTAAQMNLAAIKNEANIFTVSQTAQDANWQMDSVADVERGFVYKRAGINHWTIAMRPDAENTNLAIRRNDILGVLVDRPIVIDFLTGVVDFAQVPTVQGAPLWIAGEIRMFAASATPGTNWFLADGTNGTVNMTDRAVIASGLSAAGAALNPNLVGTANATTTGSTAISVSQMPVHGHDSRLITGNGGIGDVSVGFPSNETVMGGQRGVTGGTYARNNSQGNAIVRNEGSGAGHTHSQVSTSVIENGSDRNTVRPFSRVVEMHQYVP